MSLPRAEPDSDSGFALDEAVLARRRAAAERRLYTRQVPALRAGGFAVLCVVALLQSAERGVALWPLPPALAGLLLLNLGYAVLAWALLHWGHGRSRQLPLLLFHLDLLVWLVNLQQLEHSTLFFAGFLLVRVADQVGFGFRRALYFGHLVTGAYLVFSLVVAWLEPARAFWPERLGLAATLYLLGLYLAMTGLVTERLRARTRQAVHAARALVDSLAQKAAALEQQAAELERARQLAEQASLAKSQFLAVTSHEIRTPMNGILGATELLISTPLNPTQQRYVHTAHRSARALLGLIDDVLDLSRIEAGKLQLHQSSCELQALVADAVDLIDMTARGKPIRLSCSVDSSLPARVWADAARLRQLLVNLLHNAVKFTERGTVRLEVQRLPVETAAHAPALWLRFSVRDTGIGIAADQLQLIFEAFTQADASSTRRHGGSGLGLAIVQQLATLMGGTVQVDSQRGQGTHFWVDLPLAPAPDLPQTEPVPLWPAPAPGSAVVARVLLAEDDLVNQMVVTEMLHLLGCAVDVVDNGEAAHQAVCQRGYDLVFMDCHMPVMDGYEATRRIRDAGPPAARVPVVALTANALDSDRQRCLDAGMDGFLTKPVSSAQLSSTIEQWTGRRTQPATQW